MTSRVMWFRRDLRLRDNPALLEACDADEVVPLFVVDPALWRPAGAPRRAWLVRSLHALDASLGGALLVRHGDPAVEVPRVAAAADAAAVHVAADFGPHGRRRDAAVERALGDVPLVRTGSPYAVAPGRIRKPDGTPYRVYSPFLRAWKRHGWRAPAPAPGDPRLVAPVGKQQLPPEPDIGGLRLPQAGEEAALTRWRTFHLERLAGYAEHRNRPDLDGTSAMSAHLKYGEVHPRTILADLAAAGDSPGVDSYRGEIAWRDFYADVLFHQPASARHDLDPRFARMPYADPGPAFDAWRDGRTGYPVVDAGMRQLRAEGWMHNRVRMITASFLVKDLHVRWQHGARHFLRWLRDGDLASNTHGWQWAAGTGTDAAPYVRIFNPVSQGRRFDPDGDYVRRYVAELAHLAGGDVHEPWDRPDGYAHGYPRRVVDHAVERAEALRRYEEVRR